MKVWLCVPFEFPHLHSRLFLQCLFRGSMDMSVSQMELSRVWDTENVAVLASILEDIEGLVRKVVLLQGELVEAQRAQGVLEEKVHSLSGSSAERVQQLVVFEMEGQEQFEELSLRRAWEAEFCLTIIGLLQVWSPLSARMQAAALRYAGWSGCSLLFGQSCLLPQS
jgi:hypothetical protein